MQGFRCELPGRISSRGGLLLCGHHDRQLEDRDRTVLLQGIVSTMDLCLMSLSMRRDTERMKLLRFQRAEKAQELEEARRNLRLSESG